MIPIKNKKKTLDLTVEEILRLGINMPKMNQNLNGDIDLSLFVSDEGQTAYNRQMELLRKVKINGKSLDAALREVINSEEYQLLSDPYQTDELNKDIDHERQQKMHYKLACGELKMKIKNSLNNNQA